MSQAQISYLFVMIVSLVVAVRATAEKVDYTVKPTAYTVAFFITSWLIWAVLVAGAYLLFYGLAHLAVALFWML